MYVESVNFNVTEHKMFVDKAFNSIVQLTIMKLPRVHFGVVLQKNILII